MGQTINRFQTFLDSAMRYVQSISLNTKDSSTSCLPKTKSKSKRIIQYCKSKNETSTPRSTHPIEKIVNANTSHVIEERNVRERDICLSSDEMHYQNMSCMEAKKLLQRGYPGLCNTMIGQRRCINECMSGCDEKDDIPPVPDHNPDTCKTDGVFDVTYYLGKYDHLDRAFRYNHSEATKHWEKTGISSNLIGCDGCCPGIGRT